MLSPSRDRQLSPVCRVLRSTPPNPCHASCGQSDQNPTTSDEQHPPRHRTSTSTFPQPPVSSRVHVLGALAFKDQKECCEDLVLSPSLQILRQRATGSLGFKPLKQSMGDMAGLPQMAFCTFLDRALSTSIGLPSEKHPKILWWCCYLIPAAYYRSGTDLIVLELIIEKHDSTR